MKPSRKTNQVIEKIIGTIVLLAALATVIASGHLYAKSRNTRNWPTVEGMITMSGTRSQDSPGENGTPTRIADVRYRFVVNGITYHNDTISLAQYGSSNARHAAEEARRYPSGSRVTVFYNPEDPHDSVLEHKTPWGFIGIFAGLGTILIFIGIGMLRGGFQSDPSAAEAGRVAHTDASRGKKPTVAGARMILAVFALSTLIAFLGYSYFFNSEDKNILSSGKKADSLPERYFPHPISIYSRSASSPPCAESLIAQVAERQKIHLDDGIHSLFVTATLCIDEMEMKAAVQTHRTWPTIARHLATYDKAVFDPESLLPDTGEEDTRDAFSERLKRVESECLELLHENGIFFVEAIRFDSLQVFR